MMVMKSQGQIAVRPGLLRPAEQRVTNDQGRDEHHEAAETIEESKIGTQMAVSGDVPHEIPCDRDRDHDAQMQEQGEDHRRDIARPSVEAEGGAGGDGTKRGGHEPKATLNAVIELHTLVMRWTHPWHSTT